MKLPFLAAGLICPIFLCCSAPALASPIVVLSSSQVASAVNGVVVGGVEYNVSFIASAVDPTFDGNSTLAMDAVSELDSALNGTTASYVELQGCCSINQFIVQDAGPYAGIHTTSYFNAGGWGNTSTITGDESVAVFTAVPEPASIALLGAGLLCLCWIRRRGRKSICWLTKQSTAAPRC